MPGAFSTDLVISCDESINATAKERRALLLDLYDFVNDSEGTLSLDGEYISKYSVKSLAQDAHENFDGMDDNDTNCPTIVLSTETI